MVLEVLSPSTAAKDMILKRELYEQHGVQEYWLIQPLDHILTLYRIQGARFGPALIVETKGSTPISLLPGLEIDWNLVFSE